MVETASAILFTMLLYIAFPNRPILLIPLSLLHMISLTVTIVLINPGIIAMITCIFLMFACTVLAFYHRYTSEIHTRRAFIKYRAQYNLSENLEMAQKQSDYLLGMILPRKIIDTLGKYGGNPNARDKTSMHDTFVELNGVSILFADIVGFTDFSGKVTTATLISILSEIFAEFDVMASELDLEKIKTIGDCVEVTSTHSKNAK